MFCLSSFLKASLPSVLFPAKAMLPMKMKAMDRRAFIERLLSAFMVCLFFCLQRDGEVPDQLQAIGQVVKKSVSGSLYPLLIRRLTVGNK